MYYHGMFGSLRSSTNASFAASAARRSEAKAGEVERELHILTERLDKLVLINMAMWSLLTESTRLTEEDLQQRVQEIDLQDGVADGKVSKGVRKCGACGRTVSKRHRRCLFCGEEIGGAAFDSV